MNLFAFLCVMIGAGIGTMFCSMLINWKELRKINSAPFVDRFGDMEPAAVERLRLAEQEIRDRLPEY